jgi:hypothetical protein
MSALPDREVVERMLAKADLKLQAARSAMAQGFDDDAVSRAYYAAYHAISAALLVKGFTFSSHSQTIGAFNREFVKTGVFPVGFTRIVQRLYDERQAGDCDIDSHIDAGTASRDIDDATALVAQCRRFCDEAFGQNS